MADASLVASVVAASVSAGIATTTEAVAFALGFATAMNAPRLSTAPFTLYYHETFSGRAQPTMMMLADAGVEYERKTAVRCVRCVRACVRSWASPFRCVASAVMMLLRRQSVR